LAAAAAYLRVFRGGLLWDDAAHVTRPDLQSLHGLWRIWFDLGATQQYYPLLHSAFWVEHQLWGGAVLGYHLINILLHALAACLVVRIVRRLELPGGWLAGLIFALHPLCVESVAWISEQKSVLSGVFYLGAALAYLEFDETRRRSRYALALGLFILALLSKTVTATLPGTLLVVLWWRSQRAATVMERSLNWKPLVPFFAIGAAAGLFTAWVERTLVGAVGPETAVQRVLLAGRVIWFYAAKVVWPADLTFFYPRWQLDPGIWWQWLFPLSVIAVGVAFWRLRTRGPLAAFLIFIGTLFPVLGFLDVYPFRYSYVADHFAYLASLAIIVPAAALLSRWKAAYVLVAILGVLAFLQAGDYRDEQTLYRATLARNPAAWLAHNNLGNLLPPAEAIPHFEEALRLNPDFWEAHLSLGNALLETRLQDAIAQYNIAVRLAPRSERAHTNLGNALLQAGRTPEAIAQLEEALRLDPTNAEAHNDLGNAFSRLGRLPEAEAEYRAAPDLAEAHNNLGRILAQSGHWPDAIAEFQTALRLRPNSWSAHSNLGAALSHFPNRLPDAIAEYREALRIRPDSAAAHNNLGYALSQLPGRLPEAIAEYRAALQLDPTSRDAQYNLQEALHRQP
jgi:protein O-mannosyl-transferase